MTHRSVATSPIRTRWLLPAARSLATVISVCSVCAATTLVAQSRSKHDAHDTVSAHVPGIPNRPDMVAVVPFELAKADEPNGADVLIKAEVDGHIGIYSFDLGSPSVMLSSLFFKPDSVNKANATGQTRRLHIKLRFGTMLDQFDDPALGSVPAHPINAIIKDFAKSDCCVNGPLLGNIGLGALEQFETIIDYKHRRIVFIRLDAAGHRLVKVPAYTPTWSAPLIDVGKPEDMNHWWATQTQLRGVTVPWIFDTGASVTIIGPDCADSIQLHDDHLETDSLIIGGRRFHASMIRLVFNPYPPTVNLLGDTFLRPLGVVGFNHRAHQFLLYR